MSKVRCKFWMLGLLLALLCVGESSAQFKVPLTVRFTPTKSNVIHFGVHPSATECKEANPLFFTACDSIIEDEQPPLPPEGVEDIRFTRYIVSATIRGNPCLDAIGLNNHIRSFSTGGVQRDTFMMTLQFNAASPNVTIKWPQGLSAFADTMELRYLNFRTPYKRVNMLTADSAVFNIDELNDNAGANPYRIFIYIVGAKSVTALADPVPSFPADNATQIDTGISVQWGAVAGATSYRVEVSTSPTFTTLFRQYTITGTSQAIVGMGQLTKYYWRVSARNTFFTSCATVRSFTTKQYFGPPTLESPDSLQIGVVNNPTLIWHPFPTATAYSVEVADDTTAGRTVVFRNTLVTDTTIQIGVQPNCAPRYWRVASKRPNGLTFDSSNFSNWWKFSIVDIAPAAVVLASPADAATNVAVSPTLSWTGDICSKTYTLEVATDPLFTNRIVNLSGLTAASRQIGPLEQDTVFYWRVTAASGAGPGPVSAVRSFRTVLLAPSAPALTSPSNGDNSVSLSPTFLWTAVAHTDTYHLQISKNPGFSAILYDDSSITSTSKQVTAIFENCENYYWRVRGENRVGKSSFSSVRNFRIIQGIAGPPTLLFPPADTTNIEENSQLTWALEDSCSQRYHVQLTVDTAGSVYSVNDTLDVGVTIRLLTGLLDNRDYFWRVRSLNSLGAGSFSGWRHFKTTAITTPGAPDSLKPFSGSENLRLPITVCWDTSKRATLYRLQVVVDTTLMVVVVDDTIVTSTCVQLTGIINSQKYFWRVNARNSAGTSAFTKWQYFTTLFPPTAPTPYEPTDGQDTVAASPQFVWSQPERPESYHFQLARDAGFTSLVRNDSTILVQATQFGPLESHTRYYWRVRAKNAAGYGLFSSTFSFTTNWIGVPNYRVPLAVWETGPARDTIYLGMADQATAGIDAQFGEYELPPPSMFGSFDARFIGPPNSPSILGEGTRVNVLPFKTYLQRDTMRISFSPGSGSYPMNFGWDTTLIKLICDSMVIRDMSGLLVWQRMDKTNRLTVSDQSVTSLLLIQYGAHPTINDVPIRKREVPSGYFLSQNYPNPFNPTTRFWFSTDRSASITVTIYDVLGREVVELVNEEYRPGDYEIEWNGKDDLGSAMPSGVYYARMLVNPSGDGSPGSMTRKLLLMK